MVFIKWQNWHFLLFWRNRILKRNFEIYFIILFNTKKFLKDDTNQTFFGEGMYWDFLRESQPPLSMRETKSQLPTRDALGTTASAMTGKTQHCRTHEEMLVREVELKSRVGSGVLGTKPQVKSSKSPLTFPCIRIPYFCCCCCCCKRQNPAELTDMGSNLLSSAP